MISEVNGATSALLRNETLYENQGRTRSYVFYTFEPVYDKHGQALWPHDPSEQRQALVITILYGELTISANTIACMPELDTETLLIDLKPIIQDDLESYGSLFTFEKL